MRGGRSAKGLKRRKGAMPKIASIPGIQATFKAPQFPDEIDKVVKGKSKASGLLGDPSLKSPMAEGRTPKKRGKR
jgi:hypothetical protein